MRLLVLLAVLQLVSLPVVASGSTCYGSTSRGRLQNGCKLPSAGDNFTGYSTLGSILGRTYVHCLVSEIVVNAYAELSRSHPSLRFVYGETGLEEGGHFKPHRTHQNGLSVDFFVPVRDSQGRSVPLGTHALNRWGYDLEFDGHGKLGELSIDFEAMVDHLAALHQAALQAGVDISRVIFDPELQPLLRAASNWPLLEGKIALSDRRSWVRHDEHYHVDFAVPCKPL